MVNINYYIPSLASRLKFHFIVEVVVCCFVFSLRRFLKAWIFIAKLLVVLNL